METFFPNLSNPELAAVLRDAGTPINEAAARLLEADAKNHDLVASGQMRYVTLLEDLKDATRTLIAATTQDDASFLSDARERAEQAVMKVTAALTGP